MLPYFRSVAIVGKYMDESALQNMRDDLTRLVQYLMSQELHVCVEEQTARFVRHEGFELASLENIGHKADLVVVMGGDGTMLSVARALRDSNVSLIGINRGRLGFLTDLQTDNMLGEIEKILQGDYQLESRMLLQSEVSRNKAALWQSVALNDVVIKSAFRLIELEVHVDGLFVSRQRADGLILATPTGTTAYGLSAGGPIMHPDLHAISIVPISPHTLSYRPITVPADSVIEVIIVNAADAQISFDGQGQHQLIEGDHIRIARGQQEVQLVHPKTYCYFDMLRNKLNWG
ncbi:MAG TPA: NAD(+) kinase [Methylophilus sp.]|uniref:NAD(+) kinase n=1 Tax=Methylophilus sp. TaxID=29541 RepID=UPI002B7B9434|nr:NAD(+) kinase [Methylophilus sp.]HSH86853.1 NAD(+) kinase [Methylophilus sp.]HSI29618.1 NAD(+) kinase [Methylophilus sp.]